MQKRTVTYLTLVFCCLIFIFVLTVGCNSPIRTARNNLGEMITPNNSFSINNTQATVLEPFNEGLNPGEATILIAIEGRRYRLNCNREYASLCETLSFGQRILLRSPEYLQTGRTIPVILSESIRILEE